MKRLIPFFLLLGLTFSPATVLAQPFPEGGPPSLEGRKGKLIEELNLSTQQQQQLESVREQQQPKVETLRRSLQQLRQAMEQLNSSNASEQELRDKFRELQSVQNDLAELRFEQMLAMRQILTLEQRTKLRDLMNQRRPRLNRPQR